jgi:hypothetical protein
VAVVDASFTGGPCDGTTRVLKNTSVAPDTLRCGGIEYSLLDFTEPVGGVGFAHYIPTAALPKPGGQPNVTPVHQAYRQLWWALTVELPRSLRQIQAIRKSIRGGR